MLTTSRTRVPLRIFASAPVGVDKGHGLGSTCAQAGLEIADGIAFIKWRAGEPGWFPGAAEWGPGRAARLPCGAPGRPPPSVETAACLLPLPTLRPQP